MQLSAKFTLNLKIPEVTKAVADAARLAMRDTVVAVASDAITHSPAVTGNNRRSVFFGATGFGHTQASGEGRHEKDTWTGADESVLDERNIEGAVYSTSGYGGFLETGTVKMAARPYFRPALDKEFTQEKFVNRLKGHLK